MQCLLLNRLPQGEAWEYELKLDGYRTLAVAKPWWCEVRNRGCLVTHCEMRKYPLYVYGCLVKQGREAAVTVWDSNQ
jgi:hypothetical protein